MMMVRASNIPREDEYYYEDRDDETKFDEEFPNSSEDIPKENAEHREGGPVEAVDDYSKAENAKREYSQFLTSLDNKQKNAVKVLNTWFQLKASIGTQMTEFNAENKMLRNVLDNSRRARSVDMSADAYTGPTDLETKLDIGAAYLETKGQERESTQKKIAKLEDEISEVRKELQFERATSKSIKESCNAAQKTWKKEAEGLRAALERSRKENEALQEEVIVLEGQRAELGRSRKENEALQEEVIVLKEAQERLANSGQDDEKETKGEMERGGGNEEEKVIEVPVINNSSPPPMQDSVKNTDIGKISASRSHDREVTRSGRSLDGNSIDSTAEEILLDAAGVDEDVANSIDMEMEKEDSDEQREEKALYRYLTTAGWNLDSAAHPDAENEQREEKAYPDAENEPSSESPAAIKVAEEPEDTTDEEDKENAGDTDEFLFSDLLEMNHPDATQAPKARQTFNAPVGVISPEEESECMTENAKCIETVTPSGSSLEYKSIVETVTSSDSIIREYNNSPLRSKSEDEKCILDTVSSDSSRDCDRPKRGKIAEALQKLEKNTGAAFTLRTPSPASVRGASPRTSQSVSSTPASKSAKNPTPYSCEKEQVPSASPAASFARTPNHAEQQARLKRVPADETTPLPDNCVATAPTSTEKTPPQPPSNRFGRVVPSSVEHASHGRTAPATTKHTNRTELACVTPADRSVQNQMVSENSTPIVHSKRVGETPTKCGSSENGPPLKATTAFKNDDVAHPELAAMHTTPSKDEYFASSASFVGVGTNSARKELEELRSLLKGRGREKKEQFEKEKGSNNMRSKFRPSWAKNM